MESLKHTKLIAPVLSNYKYPVQVEETTVKKVIKNKKRKTTVAILKHGDNVTIKGCCKNKRLTRKYSGVSWVDAHKMWSKELNQMVN